MNYPHCTTLYFNIRNDNTDIEDPILESEVENEINMLKILKDYKSHDNNNIPSELIKYTLYIEEKE